MLLNLDHEAVRLEERSRAQAHVRRHLRSASGPCALLEEPHQGMPDTLTTVMRRDEHHVDVTAVAYIGETGETAIHDSYEGIPM